MTEIFNETWPGSLVVWDSGRWENGVADTSTALPGVVTSALSLQASGVGLISATGDTTLDLVRLKAKALPSDSLLEIRAEGCYGTTAADSPQQKFSGSGDNGGGATTLDVTFTGTPADGDVIFACLTFEGAEGIVTQPTDWVMFSSQSEWHLGWTVQLLYYRCDGTEGTDPSFQWSFSSSAKARLVGVAYDNVVGGEVVGIPATTRKFGSGTTDALSRNSTDFNQDYNDTVNVGFCVSTTSSTWSVSGGPTEVVERRDTGVAVGTTDDASLVCVAEAVTDEASMGLFTFTQSNAGAMIYRTIELIPARPTMPLVIFGGDGLDSGTTASYFTFGPRQDNPNKTSTIVPLVAGIQTVTPTTITSVQTGANFDASLWPAVGRGENQSFSMAVRIVEGTTTGHDIQWKIWANTVSEPAWRDTGASGTTAGTGYETGELVDQTLYGDQFGLGGLWRPRQTPTIDSSTAIWGEITAIDNALTTPVGSVVGVKAAVAQVTATADVGSTGTVVGVTAATANVTATTSIDGVGSVVGVTAQVAQVTATADVDPVGSVVGVSTATADTTSETSIDGVGSVVGVTAAVADIGATADVDPVPSVVAVAAQVAPVAGVADVDPTGTVVAVTTATGGVAGTADVDPVGTRLTVTAATADITSTGSIDGVGSVVGVTTAVADIDATADVDPVGTVVGITSPTAEVTPITEVNPAPTVVGVTSAVGQVVVGSVVNPTGSRVAILAPIADFETFAIVDAIGTLIIVKSALFDLIDDPTKKRYGNGTAKVLGAGSSVVRVGGRGGVVGARQSTSVKVDRQTSVESVRPVS